MLTRSTVLLFSVCLIAGCGDESQAPLLASETSKTPSTTNPGAICAENTSNHLLHVPSPDWRDQVVYMMFIDRFNDGDPSNNDMGVGEFQADSHSHFNGGDMQGIIDRVPYIKNLGATSIWLSPPVLNQWWSTPYAAAGWHGYWAVNFMEVDPHFGTLETYKSLSHDLHCNGMYLIQDIVINHVGNFYSYDGPYDPDDPSENFYLVEEGHTGQVAPTQYPFDQIDVRNPEHRKLGIYHWTPEITDRNDPYQKNYYSFGMLGDLNTENPLVIDAYKQSYRFWIEEVGIDAYRIDTVGYVDPPFWHHLLHDRDGIYSSAADTGRNHFLTFGEILTPSKPYLTDGEEKIVRFFGTEKEPGLNSMLGFPLYFSMRRVLSEGQPAAQLAYRLEQHMVQYPDPYVIPTFIDNHDTARFLATGSREAFRQALALIFTIPGIPIIYQGTEQALTETRQSMFDGGWLGGPDIFDPQSDPYQLIRELATLRTGNRIFTRGSLEVLAGNKLNPGLLAYRRDYDGESAIVLMNTADHTILVNKLDVGFAPNQLLEPLFAAQFSEPVSSDTRGKLNLELPARAILILQPSGQNSVSGQAQPGASIVFGEKPGNEVLESDFELTGTTDRPNDSLQLVINGNLDTAAHFKANDNGNWKVTLPVRDLGESSNYLQVYSPATRSLSDRITYTSRVTQADIEVSETDPTDDAFGPDGNYINQQHPQSAQQREIESATVRVAGRNLELQLTMKQVTDGWEPLHGFDNVAISTFFSIPGYEGTSVLPRINSEMPGSLAWELAHVASGWVSYTYRSEGASAREQGTSLGISPRISTDKEKHSISFFYEGAKLGVDDWSNAKIYITTWDMNGEGGYVPLQAAPSQWFFGGAEADSPLIMDDLLITLPGTSDYSTSIPKKVFP